MAWRTLTQHAVPATFGLKAAVWLDRVLDAEEQVRRCRIALPASMDGATANLQLIRGAIVSERLNVSPTHRPGKGPAKQQLTRATTRVQQEGADLFGGLVAELAEAGVSDWKPSELSGLLDPAANTGIGAGLVDRALGRLDIILRESA